MPDGWERAGKQVTEASRLGLLLSLLTGTVMETRVGTVCVMWVLLSVSQAEALPLPPAVCGLESSASSLS